MDTVIVQLPDREPVMAPGEPPGLLRMGPGEAAAFGRGEPGRPAPIPLPDQGVSRRAGEVTAAEDYWRLSNFSTSATYVVENLEGAGEHVKVAPGRLGAPVPFEFSRVLLPALGEPAWFKVFAPQHAYLEGRPAASAANSPSARSPSTRPPSTSWCCSRSASPGCARPPPPSSPV